MAVDILIEKLKERGAEVVLEGLKVELTPEDEDVEKCLQFGAEFVKHLLNGRREMKSKCMRKSQLKR